MIISLGAGLFHSKKWQNMPLHMLKTRHREKLLLHACLEMKQPFVVDNTNPTMEDRQRYILATKNHKFKVTGYYFQSEILQSLERNRTRHESEQIPERGIKGTYSKLKLPDYSEGFDELYYVCIASDKRFTVSAWKSENEI